MEPYMRGVIEQTIDYVLSDKQLEGLHRAFEALKPHIKSREDALFGYIFGIIVNTVSSLYTMTLHRAPTVDEFNEAVNILQARLPLIKSRIMETLT